MDTLTWPTVAPALLALLALVAGLAVVRRRRRAARPTDSPTDTVTGPPVGDEPVAFDDLEAVVAQPAEPASASVELRALRAQVRSLEQALEQAPDLPVLVADDRTAVYRHQVALTLRALASATPDDESPHRTLARVSAAMARLDAPWDLARPALPRLDAAGPATALPARPARPRTAVPAAMTTPQVTGPEPATAAAPAMSAVPAMSAATEVVLPVPPPAPSPPRRGRRRLRHAAA